MDLKPIVAKHFDRCDRTADGAQYFEGEWFKSKHIDSLEFVLDEISKKIEGLQEDNERLVEKNDDLEGDIKELQKEAVKA